MKTILSMVCLAVLLSGQAFAQPETYPLERMIDVVNKSLIAAEDQLGGDLPELQSADIKLQTVYDKSGGGGFKLFVKASKKWELSMSNTLKFSFSQPELLVMKGNEPIDRPSFETELTKAIVSASKQWKATEGTIQGLERSSFQIDISFSVSKNTSGGIEFEIWGVGVDLGVDADKKAVHSVSLGFE